MDAEVLFPFFLAFGLYLNTLPAEFAYDDSRAILKNPDILPEVPLTNLLFDDFWGTPLTHSGSHKSYRPLCVLSFRLTYLINGLSPLGYHLGNAVLHAIATATFVVMVRTVFRHAAGGDSGGPVGRLPFMAGLLFASHPIHTEAVAGVVGRADLLSCLFFLLALVTYVRYCDARRRRHVTQAEVSNGSSGDRRNGFRFRLPAARAQLPPERLVPMTGCVVFTAAAMLSKEQGITVVAVCAAYDIFVHEGLRPNELLRLYKARYRGPREGLLVLSSTTVVLLGIRLHLMGAKPPDFSPSDNPASDSESLLTRTLTFFYLPFVNFYLLVFPLSLNFDWSMGAIQLVESPTDPRNLSSVVLYAALAYALLRLLQSLNSVIQPTNDENHVTHAGTDPVFYQEPGKTMHQLCQDYTDANRTGYRNGSSVYVDRNNTNGHRKSWHAPLVPEVGSCRGVALKQRSIGVLLIGMCLLVFPFVPATNLFFYVGFVVAERVLYIPSTGYCLLVAHGAELLYTRCRSRRWARLAVRLGAIWLIIVFSLRTVVRNLDWRTEEALYRSGIAINPAKAWGNLANVLYSKGRVAEAEEAYKSALDHRSNMADVHYNLGILYQEQGRYDEAVQSYRMAIQCRPRLTMAHLNLGIVYSTVGRKAEAEVIYRRCAELDTAGLKDPRLHDQTKVSALYNLGRLLADDDRHQEAVEVYLEAIERRPNHYQPQSLYNMLGESYAKLDQLDRAEFYYRQALKAKPDHIPAHLTMAKLYHRQGLTELAEEWFQKAVQLDTDDPSVYQHYGQFLGDVGRPTESAETFLKAARIAATDFDVIFATANSLRQAGLNTDAETYYRQAVQLKPSMAVAHMNLGAMLHYNGKLKEAERSYEMALRLKPNDVITTTNLNKLRNLIGKQNPL